MKQSKSAQDSTPGEPTRRTPARSKSKPTNKPFKPAFRYIYHLRTTSQNGADYLDALLQRHARKYGYKLESVDVTTITDIESTKRQWKADGVCGLIFAQYYGYLEWFKQDWCEFAVVCVGGGPFQPYHTVQEDVTYNTRLCLEKAIASGRSRIGIAFQHHEPEIPDDVLRYGAVMHWLGHEGKSYNTIPVLRTPISKPIAFIDWYKRHRPEVLIGFVGGLITWMLRDLGVQLGHDVLFMDPSIRIKNGQYAGIVEDKDTLAQIAVDKLHSLILAGELGVPARPTKLTVPGIWCHGASYPEVISQ
ncbi:MAG: hypothetical protein SFY80_05660 [Verrucomicrobiota bacterium]|nr:hypothetical protein [Verrucomicrobiota bacterium]